MVWLEPRTRPRSITLIGWIFIAVGAVGLLKDVVPLVVPGGARHLAALRAQGLAELGPAWGSSLLAMIGGAGLLRGANWGRWLLAAWMGFHIVLSALHTSEQLLVHLALFAPMAYLMFFRPQSQEQVGRADPRRGLRAITPGKWVLVGFALLFVAYLIVLLTAPTAVGRGGR
jgi:hypothetical protein